MKKIDNTIKTLLFIISLIPYIFVIYMGINGAINGGGFNLGESPEALTGWDGFIIDVKLTLFVVWPFLFISLFYDAYYLLLRK